MDSVEDWQDDAICRDKNITHLFFHEPSYDIAKRYCARCPVADECLDYAIRTNQEYGVWGGLDEAERIAKQRAVFPGGEPPTDVTYTTNARSTGATCSAGRSRSGWSVVCRPHGYTAKATSRTIAEYAVSRPEEWCEGCSRIANGEAPKLVSPRGSSIP